jgi:membrane protease YdiL (CAAX protease family)
VQKEPNKDDRIRIRPEQLWNSTGLLQQAVFSAVLIFSYLGIYLLNDANPGAYPGLDNWLQSLHSLFRLRQGMTLILLAPLIGAALSLLIALLDTAAGLLQKADIHTWIHRTDDLLPDNRRQQYWAFWISLTGSTVEELMFRAFLFTALIPVWNSWVWAALLLSAVFSLLHTGVQGFWSSLWIFFISVLLCYFLVLGFSIYALILIHISINLMNLFGIPYLLKKWEGSSGGTNRKS